MRHVNLRAHDPDGTTTRRAIRAAVAVPIGLAITLYVLDDPTGAPFALFGLVGLLINADFAGSSVHRAGAYLVTGVGGSIALLVGWAASLSLVSAVLVTVVVGFAATFVGVFRGSVAAGCATVLLVYVVAVSIDGEWSSMGDYLAGWWVAVVTAVVTALLILPRRRDYSPRAELAEVFDCAVRTARESWATPRDEAAMQAAIHAFDSAIEGLTTRISGQRFSTTGVTQGEAVLGMLADKVASVRMLVDEAVAHPAPDIATLPERARLARSIEDTLASIATAMRDPHHLVTADGLDQARSAMTAAISAWTEKAARDGMAPEEISRQVAINHHMRIFALIAEQMAEMARVANGDAIEDLPVLPPVPRRHLGRMIAAQFAWESPWLRNALRTGIGLGIGVLVMVLTGVEHGFWVLLGVISVLRFDAVGTRRFALLAIAGTAAGVAGALALLAIVGSSPLVLWILLPALTFLSAWAAGAINFPSGQASFSAMVLIALGILAWPPQPSIGIVRVEDIALGAGVALVVGLLLWPRGAAGYLRRRLADSVRASGAYLTASISALVDPARRADLPRLRMSAVDELYLAGETYDIAILQRGPAEDVRQWGSLLSLTYLVESAGLIIADFARDNTIDDPALRASLLGVRDAGDAQWHALADDMDPRTPNAPVPTAVTDLPYPTTTRLATAEEARALVISVWVADWIRHLTRVIPDALPPRQSKDLHAPAQ